ncbi:MAG: acetate/propionate family kinase [Pseudomonadota bacterium]
MNARILTLNAGSSSLKFSLYPTDPEADPEVAGQVENIGIAPKLHARWKSGDTLDEPLAAETAPGQAGALSAVLAAIANGGSEVDVVAVAHRIVHGGPDRREGIVLGPEALSELERYTPYAPLHQPNNIAGARAAAEVFPTALQVAAFDTAFHRGHPWVNDTFALPQEYYQRGVRRYGFHGLSYTYIAGYLATHEPALHAGRTVVAHLGNGASMCALNCGRSLASTMGFSALDGLPMGTRSGQIDPGVLLYLMSEEGMDAEEITDLLYRKSGLLGLSGVSSDMRTLEATDAPAAKDAIAYFVFRIQRELGGLSAALRGLDGLIFCGGIGENSRHIRARVCEGMEWMGVTLDDAANEANETLISKPEGRVRVLTIKTNEELVLAREALRHMESGVRKAG